MRSSNNADYWQPNETQFDPICAEMFVMSNVISYFEARFQTFMVVITLIVPLRGVTPCSI